MKEMRLRRICSIGVACSITTLPPVFQHGLCAFVTAGARRKRSIDPTAPAAVELHALQVALRKKEMNKMVKGQAR
jgi:hypothetical protein